MTRPLYAVAKLDASEDLCDCGLPAAYLITVPSLNVEIKICCSGAVAYVLQVFKNDGIDLAPILEIFPKLSEACDAPVSHFVM